MDMAQGTNAILGGFVFGYFVLIIIFVITFASLKIKGYSASACFATGSWLITLTALFLRPMGLLDNYIFWVAILMTPIAAFVLFLSSR